MRDAGKLLGRLSSRLSVTGGFVAFLLPLAAIAQTRTPSEPGSLTFLPTGVADVFRGRFRLVRTGEIQETAIEHEGDRTRVQLNILYRTDIAGRGVPTLFCSFIFWQDPHGPEGFIETFVNRTANRLIETNRIERGYISHEIQDRSSGRLLASNVTLTFQNARTPGLVDFRRITLFGATLGTVTFSGAKNCVSTVGYNPNSIAHFIQDFDNARIDFDLTD